VKLNQTLFGVVRFA